MNKKKLTIVSVALILIMAVAGVLAYLTDTATVTNTFTVGNVDITLDEADTNSEGKPVDENGNPVDNPEDAVRTENGNKYHLIPGQSYVKDPTVTVEPKSEESYVRMILTVTNKTAVDTVIAAEKNGLKDYADLFAGWNETVWKYIDFNVDDAADTIAFEFRYFETVDGFEDDGTKAALELEPLFKELVVPGFVNNEELAALQECQVIVTADAIQAIGFEADAEKGLTAEEVAWAAFDAQVEAEK